MPDATPPEVPREGIARALTWLAPVAAVVVVAVIGQTAGSRPAAFALVVLGTGAVACTVAVGLAGSRWIWPAAALTTVAGVLVLFGLWAQAAHTDPAGRSNASASPASSAAAASSAASSEPRRAPVASVEMPGQVLNGTGVARVALRGANLAGANLSARRLSGRDLRGADLSGATLRGADLSGADLAGATLRGTDFAGANLSGADLSGACMRGASLAGADLTGADLPAPTRPECAPFVASARRPATGHQHRSRAPATN